MTNRAFSYESILTMREKRELRGQVFHDVDLVGVDLSGADLRDARFERVLIARSDLTGADLRGAQFVLCHLHYLELTDARLGNNRFPGTALLEPEGLTDEHRLTVEREGGLFQHPRASLR